MIGWYFKIKVDVVLVDICLVVWLILELEMGRVLCVIGIMGYKLNYKVCVGDCYYYLDWVFEVEKVVLEIDG